MITKSTEGYACGHYQPQGTADWQCDVCGMWYSGYVSQVYPGGQSGPLCPGCVKSVSGDSGSAVYPKVSEIIALTIGTQRSRHVAEIEAERDALRERVAELEAMLQRVQYGGYDWCPICDESPHVPGCELAALLGEETSDAN